MEKLSIGEWSEFEKLHLQVFKERAPSPTEATVIVEKCGEEIIGCLAVTWVPVVTSVWVHPKHRKGLRALAGMINFAMELFRDVKVAVTFTRDARVAKLHRLLGLKDEGYAASWRRE